MLAWSYPNADWSSLPSRERGLKSAAKDNKDRAAQVAPFTGAWIEITRILDLRISNGSLPSRERGLK